MRDLDELIRYEVESTAVDFKAKPYTKEKHVDLLKDVLSMANADIEDDRFIVCGVALHPDGKREVLGIAPDEFIDSASYEQLIHANIEPTINIEYRSHKSDAKQLGIFRVFDCTDGPYIMRKEFSTSRQGRVDRVIKAGEIWIRKGTRQMPITRADLDRIYAKRAEAKGFDGMVRIGFDVPGEPNTIELPAAGTIELASDRAAQEIQEILTSIAAAARIGVKRLVALPQISISIGRSRPYSEWSTRELEEELEVVKETYALEDRYELYELYSHKINLSIRNDGREHVEDARIEVEIPLTPGVRVAPRVYLEPQRVLGGTPYLTEAIEPIHGPHYPTVSLNSDAIHVVANVGDIRHQTKTLAFGVPLRIVLAPEAADRTIPLVVTVHGKNLREQRRYALTIVVTQPDEGLPLSEFD